MKAFLKAVWQLTLSTANATRQTISELSLLSLLWKLWSKGTGDGYLFHRKPKSVIINS